MTQSKPVPEDLEALMEGMSTDLGRAMVVHGLSFDGYYELPMGNILTAIRRLLGLMDILALLEMLQETQACMEWHSNISCQEEIT